MFTAIRARADAHLIHIVVGVEGYEWAVPDSVSVCIIEVIADHEVLIGTISHERTTDQGPVRGIGYDAWLRNLRVVPK